VDSTAASAAPAGRVPGHKRMVHMLVWSMDQETYSAFTAKFHPERMAVSSSDHWVAVLRPKQVTLGALVLLPREPAPDFGDVRQAAAVDLFRFISDVQRIVSDAFSPDRFNLIAAMMKDPFVHFHLIPRYATSVKFNDEDWTDQDWPRLVSFRDVDTPFKTHQAILTSLKSHLQA
jgi:diadenosine tetraphosphate (Ap4A) HIT family hydrolase